MNPSSTTLRSLVLTAGIVLVGCSSPPSVAGGAAPTPAAISVVPVDPTQTAAAIQVVESKRVCMINNRLMNVDQIPVVVADKTYFGCCPMCKQRLESDEGSRTAIDPISGKPVDKALAVIGAKPSGEVEYFESQENLRQFAAR